MPELLTMATLRGWRTRHYCQRVVATNGCFDLLHVGHLRYLEQAARFGDLLVVGVNSDESVRTLKGSTRPIIPEADRAELLVGLRCVAAVCVFPQERATQFLEALLPDVYCKGGDYSLETLHPAERAVLERRETPCEFVPLVEGVSTSLLVSSLRSQEP